MAAEGAIGKRHKRKARKNKINLVFDEEKRRDFLTGFHKRKVQRQKQAQVELQEKLKEERKRIKAEAKDSYKKLVVSRRPIPELETLFSNEFETDQATVKVVELSTNEISEKNNWIGPNKPAVIENECDSSSSDEVEEEVPGMELTEKKPSKIKETVPEPTQKFKSKKEIKLKIKKEATKNVKKSKAFQLKNKMEQLKNKKKSRRMKNLRTKSADKKGKAKHRLARSKPPPKR